MRKDIGWEMKGHARTLGNGAGVEEKLPLVFDLGIEE